jgi:hypothetical protein
MVRIDFKVRFLSNKTKSSGRATSIYGKLAGSS